ncbi:hypothetical protein FRC00_012269 [Tulasnella sp. 408]|nr:hypothetical protein FRC00_012269 [Tulasnella sp. 408]
MADTALFRGAAFPVGGAAPTEETDRSLNILGGEAGNLQRVFLNNIPCLWDPSSFTEIAELGLTNGIEVRYTDLITFFRRACNLHTLRLVNIKFVGDAPHVVEETVLLPNLKELVFAELIERVGLGFLWLSLETPACSKLRLDLRPSEAVVRHTALPERAAPVVRKALTSSSNSSLLFRFNIDTNTQSATWRSQDVDELGQSEPEASFDIAVLGLGNGVAQFFCDFVRAVRESVGDVGGTVVNVADSVCGAIDQPLGVELDDLVPTLVPDFFRGLNVVEVRADIVDEYLQLLLDMMAPPEPQVWWLDGLRTIRLYAIPDDKLALEPHETVRRSLGDFIQIISKHHYGMVLGLNEPKPSDKSSLSVVLEGEFHISAMMRQALEKGKQLWGVTIEDTDASLIYEKGTEEQEEEVSGEDVEEVEDVEEAEEADESVRID